MKTLVLTLFLTALGSATGWGQCYPDRHNTSWFDGWLSCQTSTNPNDARGESHWISYDFGQVYAMNEFKIWNVNDPDILEYGAQHIVIDYSIDGVTWTEFGQEKLPMAPGISTYEGDIVLDFGGLNARYLLLTVIDNYGGECTGFSEMRIAVKDGDDESSDICIIADIYPNPFLDEFSVFLKKKCLGDVYMTVEDATGRIVREEETIKLHSTVTIDAEYLNPGVYFVCLRSGEIRQRYKIVKY